MNDKTINNIVWWIPIRKLRDKVRYYLLELVGEKKYMRPKLKYLLKTILINGENIQVDEENRKLIKDILINSENENNSILHNYFIDNNSNAIHKGFSYFDLYERYFSRFKGRDINLLEIGVQNGGSTKMWEYYFKKINPNFKINIFGIDIDNRVKSLGIENENIKLFVGSQSDRDFLRKLKSEIPKIDILIDDGGHRMEEQIITFEEMYPHIKDDGIYWCEDCHTSYCWRLSGGCYGYKNPNSYIEYMKNLIDSINAYYATKKDSLEVSNFTNTAYGIYFHEKVVVVEKKLRNPYYNVASEVYIGKSIIY